MRQLATAGPKQDNLVTRLQGCCHHRRKHDFSFFFFSPRDALSEVFGHRLKPTNPVIRCTDLLPAVTIYGLQGTTKRQDVIVLPQVPRLSQPRLQLLQFTYGDKLPYGDRLCPTLGNSTVPGLKKKPVLANITRHGT